MKNLEIRTIEHKEVKVTIRIDYDKGTASLMEYVDNSWKRKKWLFADRGLEYMNGWQNVLEAMQEAVKLCKIELEEDLARKTAFKNELIEVLAGEDLKKNEVVSISKGKARKVTKNDKK